MILRHAALALMIGCGAGLCGPGPALAEITLDGSFDPFPEPAAEDPAIAPICLRNAGQTALSAASLFDVYAQQIASQIYLRQIEDDAPPGISGMVVAEQVAALPQAARDLPLLMILASHEVSSDPIMALMLSPDAVLLPDLMAMLDRQGLADTLRAFRLAQAAMPLGARSPEGWARAYAASDPSADLATARAGLQAAARLYPAGVARRAGTALIDSDPAVSAAVSARLATAGPDATLYWLLQQLWRDCYQDTYSADEADRAYSRLGTPQTALLLLDALQMDLSEGSVEYYFYGYSSTMAPTLARILDIRGLSVEADAIRTGMALFPAPYPRDIDLRAEAMNRFTDDQMAQLQALGAVLASETIWAEMQLIARDAGLLPGF